MPGRGRRIALLVNPVAGGRHGVRTAVAAAGRLRERGAELTVLTGRDAEESRELARNAVQEGVDVLAVAGGDGMLHLAVQALAGTDTPLGVLPAGTGNDFARALGIPRNDSDAAAELLLTGTSRPLSLARVTGPDGGHHRWFNTVLTSGFDSLVVDRANRMRWPRGRARYNLAILAELGLLRPLPFTLEVDGERHELEATLIAVGNTSSYGGGMRICPTASPDDDHLSVTVVPAVGRARLLRVFPRVYRGTHISHPAVLTFTARRVRLDTPATRAYADGEPLGALPLTAEAVPSALHVLTPGRTPDPSQS